MAQQPIPKKSAAEIKPVITSIVDRLIGIKNASPKAAPKAEPKAVEKKVAPKVEPKKVMPKEAPKTVVVVPPAKEVEVVKAEDNTGFNDPEYVAKSYKSFTQESASPDSEDINFRAGLYSKKNGDVFETEKYKQLNKSGRLKAYLKEFKNREAATNKVIKEKEGKIGYDLKERLNVEALKKDVLNSLKGYK
jgi:hypothetical protein